MYTLKVDSNSKTPWIFWIQDPRPWYEWREINTVSIAKESCYWNDIRDNFVHDHATEKKGRKIRFISQATCLNEKALDLYRLDNDTKIDFVPNPVEFFPISDTEELFKKKTDLVIFLGRLDDVKRVWIFCEIAKVCPEYRFCVLGDTVREESLKAIEKYRTGIPNLEFVGHVEGEQKNEYLVRAKILINTSIHEALPVSFLEALSFGTLLVSNQNPDQLTERFGRWVGRVSGNGLESVPKFAVAVRELMENKDLRETLAKDAINYVRTVHSPENVFPLLEKIIRETVADSDSR